MSSLSRNQLEDLVVKMVTHGNGSLDYVNITARSSNEPPESVAASDLPPFCKCGNYREMAKDIENKCCDKVTCHRNQQLFVKYCLDVDNLQQNIRERSDIRADRSDFFFFCAVCRKLLTDSMF